MSRFVLLGLTIIAVLYCIFSFAFVDPNLIFSTHPGYLAFQDGLRSMTTNRQLVVIIYSILITCFIGFYLVMLKNNKDIINLKKTNRKMFILIGAIFILLTFSYNALSHDLFNYIFNAKMLISYQTDPHVHVALEFTEDTWTRFMHNTHTTAPYGYGWTIMSIIPYVLGLGKFTVTWLSFKLFSLLSLLALLYLYKKEQLQWSEILLIGLNPLLLIEVLGSGHNDLFMMLPALIAYIYLRKQKQFTSKSLVLIFVLLAISISTKFATVVLIPLYVFYIFGTKKSHMLQTHFATYLPMYASLALFIPLLTSRSQYFHPWYLIWSLVWIPFFPATRMSQLWKACLVIFSVVSLYRYIPWIYYQDYTALVMNAQRMITWIPSIVLIVIYYLTTRNDSNAKK